MSLFFQINTNTMTRDPSTGTFQGSNSWEDSSDYLNSSSTLNMNASSSSRNVHVLPSNGMNHTISKPWHNPVNQSDNCFTSFNSNKDNTRNCNAFSWIDNAATNSLTENLSELNIRDDRPRPTKIRRRNALTILDHHFPNPNTVKKPASLIEPQSQNTSVDAFEGASFLQSVEQKEKLSPFDQQHPKR